MAKKNDPCSICENYMVGVACQNEACPVFEMKVENLHLKKTIYNLRSQKVGARCAVEITHWMPLPTPAKE